MRKFAIILIILLFSCVQQRDINTGYDVIYSLEENGYLISSGYYLNRGMDIHPIELKDWTYISVISYDNYTITEWEPMHDDGVNIYFEQNKAYITITENYIYKDGIPLCILLIGNKQYNIHYGEIFEQGLYKK